MLLKAPSHPSGTLKGNSLKANRRIQRRWSCSPLNTPIGGNNPGLLLRGSGLVVLSQGHSLIAASLLGAPHDPPGVTHPGSGQGLTLQEGHHTGAATELAVNAAAAQGLVNLQKPCTRPAYFSISVTDIALLLRRWVRSGLMQQCLAQKLQVMQLLARALSKPSRNLKNINTGNEPDTDMIGISCI